MRHVLCAPLALLFAMPLTGYATEQLVPAGSLIECTISEPNLSSKTVDIGDPVLCQIGHAELAGGSAFPYGSYLIGRFEAYKDPGHFVGKGWMELKFDRMAMPPDQVMQLTAKVVGVTGYTVDKEGRIRGKGHPVRDAVEWSIPILWPIDLLNLPRRGPRPVLKNETRLTVKIMDDLVVYLPQPGQSYHEGFAQRAPMAYMPPAGPPLVRRPLITYTPPPPRGPALRTRRPLTILVTRDGQSLYATYYWFRGGTQICYIGENGTMFTLPIEDLDLARTVQINSSRGVDFVIRSAPD